MKWEEKVKSTGLIEHICRHGVGHPDYESAMKMADKYGSFQNKEEQKEEEKSWLAHNGCCKCCERKDFPGKKK